MLNERRDGPGRLNRLLMDDSKLTTRLRLFGLLALLIPLFAGLQYVVREGVPRVEVRLLAQDVQTTVPVEVPVERVVERVVYVPVGSQVTVPPTAGSEPVRTRLRPARDVAGEPAAQVGGLHPTAEARVELEAPAPVTVAEPAEDPPPLIGTVALAPPPAPAPARLVAARTVPVVPVAAPPEEDGGIDEAEAEAPYEDGDETSDVAEAPPDPRPGELVAHFQGDQPVPPEVQRASIAIMRRELAERAPQPEPDVAAAEEEPAAAEEAAADEPESTEPVAASDDGEPGPELGDESMAVASDEGEPDEIVVGEGNDDADEEPVGAAGDVDVSEEVARTDDSFLVEEGPEQ